MRGRGWKSLAAACALGLRDVRVDQRRRFTNVWLSVLGRQEYRCLNP